MKHLQRDGFSVGEDVWSELNDMARKVLTTHLSARRFVDVTGPLGWEYSALPLGALDTPDGQSAKLSFGIRKSLPLVEVQRPFELDLAILDSIERGDENPNLDPLAEAVKEAAAFEENAVYNGFQPGHIEGLSQKVTGSVPYDLKEDSFLRAVEKALDVLRDESVSGPWMLAASPVLWSFLTSAVHLGNALDKLVRRQIGDGKIVRSTLEGDWLISERGGDFELVLGQDFSLRYKGRCSEKARFAVLESFTFRVVNPEAAVKLVRG
jgi:uncharacterized linocin/CFP29 family protein